MNHSELDYYAILNVPRTATKPEITLAYRKLAIRLCPHRDIKHEIEFSQSRDPADLTHMRRLPLHRQWEYINMAYDVLGNELYRSIYDRFGEAGLFEGILLPNGYFPPYQYHGEHLKVYNDVFGTFSPYANVIDAVTNPPLLYASSEHGIGVRTKDAPVEKMMSLELEEVRFGTTKLMQVWYQEFVDKKQTRTEQRMKTLKIDIEAGVTPGTRYTFKDEGDRGPTIIPADIVFIAIDKPHKVYKRQNHHDLIYTHTIDVCEALVGCRFIIETLDGRVLKQAITDVIRPGYTKLIPGEGLPKCQQLKKPNAPTIYGDLIVQFDVKYPDHMTYRMKLCTRQFFAELNKMIAEEQADVETLEAESLSSASL